MKDAFDKFVEHIQTIPEYEITLEGPIGLYTSIKITSGRFNRSYSREQVNAKPDIFWRDVNETAKLLGRLSIHTELRQLKFLIDELLK